MILQQLPCFDSFRGLPENRSFPALVLLVIITMRYGFARICTISVVLPGRGLREGIAPITGVHRPAKGRLQRAVAALDFDSARASAPVL